MWRKNIEVEVLATNPQLLLTRVSKGNEKVQLVPFVYDNPSHYLRNKLWENLSKDKLPLNKEWITVGD